MSERFTRPNAFERKGIASARRRSSTLEYIKLFKENQKEMLKNREHLTDRLSAATPNNHHPPDTNPFAKEVILKHKHRSNLHKTWNHADKLKSKGSWQNAEEGTNDFQSQDILTLLEEFAPNFKRDSLKKTEGDPTVDESLKKKHHLQHRKGKTARENLILPCSHCHQKGRKGTYIGCKHYFCFECLEKCIQKHLDQLRMPIKCMFPDCIYELTRAEMIKYAANPQEVITYLDYHLPEAIKSRHDKVVRCFNKGCPAMINIAKCREKNTIACQNCKMKCCLTCRRRFAQGHNCEGRRPARAKTVMAKKVTN